jgi:flagellin-like protein
MRIFRKDEEAVSPVIGVILMVAITVILAAVIAAFVFGLGGQQAQAPTASIVAANNPDTPTVDLKIQHKGGDILKGGEWKLSIVPNGDSPTFINSATGSDLAVGSMIITHNTTSNTTYTATVTNSSVYDNSGSGETWTQATKYDVKLVHIPSNAMLLDQVIEVR